MFVEGNKIIAMKRTKNDEIINQYFNYDERGLLVGITIEDQEFFYIRDITGTIIRVINGEGTTLINYKYNGFGVPQKLVNPLLQAEDEYQASLVYNYNPFMYKGYFYDEETGYYYLNTRYYNPTIGRFISADGAIGEVGKINDMNLYAYCNNNPVNFCDENGNWPSWATKVLIGVGIIAVLAVVTGWIWSSRLLCNKRHVLGRS